MTMKKASADDYPLWQGAGKSFGLSQTWLNGGGGLQYFLWIDV
jgi:hypothetical protein